MKLSAIKTRVKRENEGVWSVYEGDFALKIVSSSSLGFRDIRKRLIREKSESIRENGLSALTDTDLMELYAEAAVLDIRGLEDDEGAPIEYSAEKMVELFTLDYALFNWVVAQSDSRAAFQAVQESKGEKN